MIDTALIDVLKGLVVKEKKVDGYKRRLRIKGKVAAKALTKKGNIILTLRNDQGEFRFTVLKSHKERFALAEKIAISKTVSAEGILKFRIVICTSLKVAVRGLGEGRQVKLESFG